MYEPPNKQDVYHLVAWNRLIPEADISNHAMILSALASIRCLHQNQKGMDREIHAFSIDNLA